MNKLIEYIAEIEGTGVSSRGDEIFIEKDGDWEKLSSTKLGGYQSGYKEWLVEKRKEGVELNLITLADTKQQDAQKLILGYKATQPQIERYKDKYERAKEGEFDDATNQVIIEKFEYMRSNNSSIHRYD